MLLADSGESVSPTPSSSSLSDDARNRSGRAISGVTTAAAWLLFPLRAKKDVCIARAFKELGCRGRGSTDDEERFDGTDMMLKKCASGAWLVLYVRLYCIDLPEPKTAPGHVNATSLLVYVTNPGCVELAQLDDESVRYFGVC